MFEKKVLGLDIGSKYIKMALVKQSRKPVVLKTLLFDTPEDSVADGELRNIEAVASKIRTLIKENKINASELCISLSSPNAVIRDVKLPILKAAEIGPAVEFELSQSFPGILQTHSISSKVYSASNMPVEGIAAFCPNKILDGYVELTRQIGIPLKVIDINANTIVKAFSNFVPADQGYETLMIVDVGYTTSQVNLISAGKLLLSRQISSGMAGLDSLVANRMNISVDQAEKARMSNKYETYNIANEDIDGFIRIAFSAVEEQIRQTIDYYRYNKANVSGVSRILLSGGGSLFVGLESHLTDIFNIPVSEIKPEIKSSLNEPILSMFMSAIGAALAEHDSGNYINLIPRLKELKAASGKTVKYTMLVAVVAVLTVLAVGVYIYYLVKADRMEAEEAAIQNEIKVYSTINETKTKLKASQDRLTNLSAALEQYNTGVISNTVLFDHISGVMPDAVFSVNYSFMNVSSINISGISRDRVSIADFIYSLKQVEGINGVTVSSISTRSGVDGNPIDFNFALEIKLKG